MVTKRKPGRPKGRTKGELAQIRISKLEKQSFADAAILDGKSFSEWARDRLRRLAREELQKAGRPVPFLS